MIFDRRTRNFWGCKINLEMDDGTSVIASVDGIFIPGDCLKDITLGFLSEILNWHLKNSKVLDSVNQMWHHGVQNISGEHLLNILGDGGGFLSNEDWGDAAQESQYRAGFGKRPPPPVFKSYPKPRQDGWVYLIKCCETGHYKIGISKDPDSRITAFSTTMPLTIEKIHVFKAEDYRSAEVALHERYENQRYRGEWFTLTKEDVKDITKISAYKDGQFQEA